MKKIPLSQRLAQTGAAIGDGTPGCGLSVYGIYQGVSLLTGCGYPMLYFQERVAPRLALFLPEDALLLEDATYRILKLSNNHDGLEDLSPSEVEDIQNELLYFLYIWPFRFLDEVERADTEQKPTKRPAPPDLICDDDAVLENALLTVDDDPLGDDDLPF